MKCLLFIAILAVFVTPISTQNLCVICNPVVAIPTDWFGAQLALNVACNVLYPEISAPCSGLFNSLNLSANYPQIYPYVVAMRNQMCKKCPAI